MYIFGGADASTFMDGLFKFDLATFVWKKIFHSNQAPGSRMGHSFKPISKSDILLFGGFVSDENVSDASKIPLGQWSFKGSLDNSLFTFDTSSENWTQQTCTGDIPTPRAFHASCVCNGKLYIHGGFTSGDFSETCDDFFVLEFSTLKWTQIREPGPSSRAGHSLVAIGPDIFMFGDNNLKDNALYRYSTYSGKWSKIETRGMIPIPRRFFTMVSVDAKIFVYGGETVDIFTETYVMDTAIGMNWVKPFYAGEDPICVRGQAGCVYGDRLVVFGGVCEKPSLIVAGHSEITIVQKLSFLTCLELKAASSGSESRASTRPSTPSVVDDLQEKSVLKLKFVTVGDSGVGKSCLLTRFVSDEYSEQYLTTIGVDFQTVVCMCRGTIVRAQLWDTAGQERFSVITGNYYRNADVFVIVYDATNRTSFDHVDGWVNQIKQHHNMRNVVKLLCANKADMVKDVVVSEREGRAKAESIGAVFVPTSARTGRNVDYAFLTATQHMADLRKLEMETVHSPTPESIRLASAIQQRSNKQDQLSNCCAST